MIIEDSGVMVVRISMVQRRVCMLIYLKSIMGVVNLVSYLCSLVKMSTT